MEELIAFQAMRSEPRGGRWGAPGAVAVGVGAALCAVVAVARAAGDEGAAHDSVRWQAATRFGASGGGGVVWDSALGPDGSLYVVGQAFASDFPVRHPHQPRYAGNGDAFVARIAPDRRSFLYATYLGGSGNDTAVGVAAGPTGKAYVVGVTESADFPLGAGATVQRGAGYDLFAVRLSESGALEHSAILGGEGNDGAEAVAVAPDGSVLVAGSTTSAQLPLVEPFQAALNGPADGLVLRLDGATGALLASSYLGGSGLDDARAVAIDGDGAVYVAGNTDSRDLPRAQGSQPTYGGGRLDIFLARLSGDGRELLSTAYLGGSDEDAVGQGALTLSPRGPVIAGSTSSLNFPVAGGPVGGARGYYDAVVALLDPGDLSLRFSTYLGGSDSDFATQAVVFGGRIYVTGTTSSPDFPTVCPARPMDRSARYNAYLAAIDLAAPALVYSTFAGTGTGSSLVVDRGEALLVAGDGVPASFQPREPWPLPHAETASGFVLRFAAARSACPGDCCADGAVTVDELVTAVAIALGTASPATCASLDVDADGQIGIHELVLGVGAGLAGCGAPAPS